LIVLQRKKIQQATKWRIPMQYSDTKIKRVWFAVVLMFIAAFSALNAEAAGWSSPVRLDTNGNANVPRVATDEQGNAIAVWVQSDAVPQKYGLWSNQYVPGKGWGQPVRINSYAGQADWPSIAMNAHGRAMAVWAQYSLFDPTNPQPFSSSLWASYYEPGHGWSKPQQIEGESTSPNWPSVMMDESGNGVAVYLKRNTKLDVTNVYARSFNRRGDWGAAKLLQQDTKALAAGHIVALNARGQGIATWAQFDTKNLVWRVWSNRLDPDKGWQGAITIPGAAGEAGPSGAGIAKNGDAHVVWGLMNPTNFQNNAYDSFSSANARWNENTGWSQPMLLQANGDINADNLVISVNDDGVAMALWRELTDMYSYPFTYQMRFNRYVPGSGWGGALTIGDPGTNFSGATRLALDNQGNAVAVWLQVNPDAQTDPYAMPPWNVYALRYRVANGWGIPLNLQPGAASAGPPDLAATNTGDAVAVWNAQNQTDGSTTEWASVLNQH
jgi:hypothetical protein